MTIPALPADLLHPEMMVIGDSLAQGCRSLTVRKEFCAASWGSYIAAAQGWRFVTPDLPQPILFDLEQEIRQLGDLINLSPTGVHFEGIITRLMTNLRLWLTNPRSPKFTAFDNLGLSGAQPYDLYTRTAAASQQEIERIVPNAAPGQILVHRDHIGALHLAINARYTLNPSQNPAFASFTPMDWVRARLPRRLFVQIGHNNGLYAIGGDATDKPFDQDNLNQESFYDSFKRLGDQLAALPTDVQGIVCLLLPKVSAVANLRPSSSVRDAKGYAEAYDPVFSTANSVLTGARLAQIDAGIEAGNQRIMNILKEAAQARGTAGRLRFFDSFHMFEKFDFKNRLEASRRIPVDGGHTIDNFYVTGRLAFGLPLRKELARGGFQDIDGMHPSACGYAVLARELIAVLALKAMGSQALPGAFTDDGLLRDFPLKLNMLVDFLSHLRMAHQLGIQTVSNKPVVAEADPNQDLHVQDALSLLKSIFDR